MAPPDQPSSGEGDAGRRALPPGVPPGVTGILPQPGERPVTPSDLLAWSIAQQEAQRSTPLVTAPGAGVVGASLPSGTPREPLDPKWIDVILGKPDAVRMRDCMDTIESESADLAAKMEAFDELELLVESLDNANDLRVLGLWKRVLAILDSPHPELREYACWVLGTAVQNNLTAQLDFLQQAGLPKILRVLEHDPELKVKTKSIYCISAVIRTCPEAFRAFQEQRGFPVLLASLGNADLPLLRRVLFFLTALVGDVEVCSAALASLRDHAFLPVLRDLLQECADEDVLEKAVDLLLALDRAEAGFLGAGEERTALAGVVERLRLRKTDNDTLDGVDGEKVEELLAVLQGPGPA